MSIKKNIYADIKAKLNTAVTELKHISVFNSQFTNESTETVFAYPCCFFEFQTIDWQQMYQNAGERSNIKDQQKGDLTIVLHIGINTKKNEELAFFDIDVILDKIHYSVTGFETEYHSPFIRGAERQPTNHNNVMVWEVEYSALVIDSGQIDTSLVEATPITPDFKKKKKNTSTEITNYTIRTSADD